MKNILVIALIASALFSCKSKKSLVNDNAPLYDTVYVEDPLTGNLTMSIIKRATTPDGEWKLMNVSNKHDDEMERVTLNIRSNKAEGFDGCNSYFCDLSDLTKSKIKFGPLSISERQCIIAAKYADVFYNHLKAATHFEATEKYLTLKDANGKLLLHFVKQE